MRTEPGAKVLAEIEARKRSHGRATASFRNEEIGQKIRVRRPEHFRDGF
jgi:hypothetical protein